MVNNVDKITKNVEAMYKKYPYPSPSTDPSQTNELLNLLRIYELESKIKLKNQKILDAGSGTGHRITNVAQYYTKCNFCGIDISEKSLEISNELKIQRNIQNIEFQKGNLMKDISIIGKFDIILCMGVLHHLSNPAKGMKNILNVLTKEGIIFLYLYGKLGGHKRMLNKKLVSILLGKKRTSYESGIKLVRGLGLNKFEYGWNLNFKNEKEENSLIVDYLLHANEVLYDFDDIQKLFKNTNLYGYSFFGITTGTQGLLFDSSSDSKMKLSIPQTNITKFLKSDDSIRYYKSLSIEDKYRVIDILYEPNGYTIIGFTKQAFEKLSNKRLKKNVIKIK